MANRTTVKQNIATLNVPTVTNAELSEMLVDNICDNVKFKEDVIVSQTSSVSNITCNFTGIDRIDLTRLGGDLNITINGLSDGEEKWLHITKTLDNIITFANAVDVQSTFLQNQRDYALLISRVFKKGTNIFNEFIGVTLIGKNIINDISGGTVEMRNAWDASETNSRGLVIGRTSAAIASKIATDNAAQDIVLKAYADGVGVASNSYADGIVSDLKQLKTAVFQINQIIANGSSLYVTAASWGYTIVSISCVTNAFEVYLATKYKYETGNLLAYPFIDGTKTFTDLIVHYYD